MIVLIKCLRSFPGCTSAQLHNCTHGLVMSAPFQLYFAILLFFVSDTKAALFKTLSHGVEGEVKVEGHTIVVENFSYDGTAPDAFFYVGTSGCPSGAGTRLGDEQLGEHSRQRIELELPNNIRAGEMTWVPIVHVRVMQVT